MSRDAEIGAALREAGIDQVEMANLEWVDVALYQARQVAKETRFFTSDAIWSRVGRHPNEPRAMGAVMRALRREGIAEPTATVLPSLRPQCHRRPVRIWRSLVFHGPQVVAA